MTNGSLAGTVTKAATGEPIAGATVTAGGLAADTDAGGHYSFASIATGTYTVTASCAGFD